MDMYPLTGKLRPKLLAGNALFTVQNQASGNHLTYKILQCRDNPRLWFVRAMTGPDNTSHFTYLGTIREGVGYQHGRKSRIGADATVATVFNKVWQRLECLPATIKVFHAGQCMRCGRTLSVPESIESGYGPECIKVITKA